MPEYFFHVAIELHPDRSQDLCPNADLSTKRKTSLALLVPFARHPKLISAPRTAHKTASRGQDQTRSQRGNVEVECKSFPEYNIRYSVDDHRLDEVFVEGTDMMPRKPTITSENSEPAAHNLGGQNIGSSTRGSQTKGKYTPLEQVSSGPDWGIVHLYRDADETPSLYESSPLDGADLWFDGTHKKQIGKPHPPPKDEECTTLCILAVPSYLSPADFLAFVGEDTRNQVSHFRMIRTSRTNRYMVLMKFRHGREARRWQNDWNGKVFNSMEPETCHVVFLKSVEILNPPTSTNSGTSTDTTYPKTPNDPFSAPLTAPPPSTSTNSSSSTVPTKPLPPPTPSLVELPTCPVCLERMDETTGLLTILCQHVFHCTCLEKWSGGGCPVCRYTHDDFTSRRKSGKSKLKKHPLSKTDEYEVADYEDYEEVPLECETCQGMESLWQCLICGRVGCGRYEGKHAHQHYEQSGHCFSMDLESKRVWDYGSDGYVHRIIQDGSLNGGEKLVELPSRRRGEVLDGSGEEAEWGEKMDSVALEYTHLLTSQLESQRVYFEEVLERAVDKASSASKRAGDVEGRVEKIEQELSDLRSENQGVTSKLKETEKERDRAVKKGDRFEVMARDVGERWREERKVVEGLMERIKFLEEREGKAAERVVELEEENRDLMLNFSMAEKLQGLAAGEGGEIDHDEIAEGTVGVPEKVRRKGKGRR